MQEITKLLDLPGDWQYFVKKPVAVKATQTMNPCLIKTIEGTMRANAGDWIVEGVEGEIWPVKDSIFRKTYEKLLDENLTEELEGFP